MPPPVNPTQGTRALLLFAPTMSDISDSGFHKGQAIWVIESDGNQRAAEYVGEGETSAWFGGPPKVFVVYEDTRAGGAVDFDRVIPRDT